MNVFRQLPAGLTASILFCALIFACFLLSPNTPTSSAPSPQSTDPTLLGKRSDDFVPGGIKVSRNGDQPTLPSEVLFIENPQTPENPLALDELHVRGRTLKLAGQPKLQPPPLGQEDKAVREFVFDLFDDVQLIGKVERLERHHDDRAVYYGSLANVRGGDFILAYNEGHVAATFHTPGMGTYQIRPRGDGTVAALELDLSKLPPCDARFPISAITGLADVSPSEIRAKAAMHAHYALNSDAPRVEGGTYNGAGQQGGDGDGLTFTTIDVLVVSTQNATAAAGGSGPMGAIFDVTFARANSVFINSEVGLRLRMVRSENVVYNEINRTTSLENLTDGVGAFSDVPTWRNDSGADLVALIFDGGGGLAWLHNGNSAYGYSVNGLSSIESTFIHEIGHNLGCRHDRENNTSNSIYPYGFGWRFTPEGSVLLSTVMSYAPGNNIPYFSNPDVTYMGTPTGVPIGQALQSNNAEVIRQTKALAAAFRAENGNSPPSVVLESPAYEDPLKALDSITLTATATDSNGSIEEVRFYRLMSDDDFVYAGTFSTSLGSDVSEPYAATETSTPAGFWTYAAVAQDDSGGIGVDTVSVTVAPHYRSKDLPLPVGKLEASLEGLNEAGRLVGFGHNGSTSATNTQAAYWENGDITLLNPLAGDTGAKALAVGQDGVVYGESISGSGTRRAVQWNGSTSATDISGLIGGFTAQTAMGVDIQGRIHLAQGNSYRRYNGPGSSTAAGINVRWQTVANTGFLAAGFDYDFGPGAWRALRWNDTGTLLPPVAGFASSWGRATNRSGAVFGISSPDGSSFSSSTARLTFWQAGSTVPMDLGTLGSEGGTAYGLNDWNEAVGTARNAGGGSVAAFWKGQGSLIRLSDLVLPRSGSKREARVINNRGQIAGTGADGADSFIFFLDPLPGLGNRYWLANHFDPAELENETLTADGANPTGDGLSNLVKRAFGLDPRIAATAEELAKLPDGSLEEDGHYHFRYRRLRAPRDIEYLPQGSLTLETDSWDENLFEHVGTTHLADDFEEIELRTKLPIDEEDKAFIRLRLSR